MPVITFNLNGGEGVANQISYTPGGLVTIPLAPVREHFVFRGWDGYAPGFSYREWSVNDKTITAQWEDAATASNVSGTAIVAAGNSVIFILSIETGTLSALKFQYITRSILAFNINKTNAVVKVGNDIQFKHIFAGYISDVLIRPKQNAVETQIDFQYTAWETDSSLNVGNVYPLSSIIGNPESKVLCPYTNIMIALY